MTASFLWASAQAALIVIGYLCWWFVREQTAGCKGGGVSWLWMLPKLAGIALLAGGFGYASAVGAHCGPEDPCFYEDANGSDPDGAFYRWLFLAGMVGLAGLISGCSWYDDPPTPNGRFAKKRTPVR